MSITFTLPNVGLLTKMRLINENVLFSYLNHGLFTSPASISDTLNFAALTQATFPGYAEAPAVSGLLSGGATSTVASLSLQPCTFTASASISSAQTIQGAYTRMVVSGGDLFAFALLPGGPQVVSQAGDSIVTQLTITDQRAAGQP